MTIFDLLHSSTSDAATPPESGREAVELGRDGHPAAQVALGAYHGDALGRLATYRRAFRAATVTCPAELLGQPGVQDDVRTRGHTVDVHSVDELVFATSLGIPASRLVLHDDGRTAAPLRCGMNAGVGRIVVGCPARIKVLASCARRPQRILLDVTAGGADATVDAVFRCKRLDLIGMHTRLTAAAGVAEYVETVSQMVAQMAWTRRHHHVILTRVSLAGGEVLSRSNPDSDDLRTLTAELEDAFDDACARFRFPRPALIVTLR
ncbi:MAG: hypothetical protein QOJ80_2850 [Mycobacterium sp.]|nr:hypothetical protein [Mycobacterium sp.]